MITIKDDLAKSILSQAHGAYLAKFNEELPIFNVTNANEIDQGEAQRIFDYVKSLKEPLEHYDNNVFY